MTSLLMAGKTALITGGSRGIGLEIARLYAQEGANVLISSRKEAALQSAVTDIVASGVTTEVRYLAGNAGDPDFAQQCVAETIAQFGGLDVLVNNAGTNPYNGPLIDIDLGRARKTVEVNYLGPLVWSQAAWRQVMQERGGVIVNMASAGGLSVNREIGFYNTTKAALIHLTKHLALELGPKVRVNAIAPGLIKTDMARALWEEHEAKLAARLPLDRLGESEDVARTALYLASDLSSYVTGHTILIDGGALLRPPL